jgi:Tol biopolymer transport system component
VSTYERFESDMPALLDELAPPRRPDYLDAVFGRTANARQRGRWTFVDTWLPVSVVTSRAATFQRVPGRLVALTILALLALAIAGAVLVGALRQSELPAFGIAGNGRIAYASGNDIYAFNPATGSSRQIITGPDLESDPRYSPDGSRLAYKRQTADGYEIVTATADGSDQRVVAKIPVTYWSGYEQFEWTPDGRSLLINIRAFGELRLYDATTPAEPRVLARGVSWVQYRPPWGDQILFRRLDMSGTGLYTMRADGSNERQLLVIPLGQSSGDADLDSASWSPDGSEIAFIRSPQGAPDELHLYRMSADGSDVRELPIGKGMVGAYDVHWSPDGTRMCFLRWDVDGDQSIGLLTLATGYVTDVGPPLGDASVNISWSPDGQTILAVPDINPRLIAIDPDDGSWEAMGSGISVDRGLLNSLLPSWQRKH